MSRYDHTGGEPVLHLFGALGQFERDLIRERTRAGLAAAAARGRKGGRKPVVNAGKLARTRGMGVSVREAATRLKIGKTGLYEAPRARTMEINSP
jgi:DNA invertase Pin-like site-specific DNA recombinase